MADGVSRRLGAVFYPHIHFRSREWLRSSLLYYDHLVRIAEPEARLDAERNYRAFLPGNVRPLVEDIRALKANGFLRQESPAQHVSELATPFAKFVETHLLAPANRKQLEDVLKKRQSFRAINPRRIDPELARLLEELGVIKKKTQTGNRRDIKIEHVTGAFYMLFLADRMVARRSLVTDSAVYQSMMYHRVPEGELPSRRRKDDRDLRLATAVIKTVVPSRSHFCPD